MQKEDLKNLAILALASGFVASCGTASIGQVEADGHGDDGSEKASNGDSVRSTLSKKAKEKYDSMTPEQQEKVHKMMEAGCAGKNGCKGQGGCATADHACAGKNECKGHGGCANKNSDDVVDRVHNSSSTNGEKSSCGGSGNGQGHDKDASSCGGSGGCGSSTKPQTDMDESKKMAEKRLSL